MGHVWHLLAHDFLKFIAHILSIGRAMYDCRGLSGRFKLTLAQRAVYVLVSTSSPCYHSVMSQTHTATYVFNGKSLNALAVSLNGQKIPAWLDEEIRTAFEKLAPYIKNDNQVIYLRDIKFLAIDGKYPGGHCYNSYEAMIALPDWEADKQQVVATINHELHHMARWQNPGYGDTLGGAVLSEGIATYYEEMISGWTPPWAQADVSSEAFDNAIKNWTDNQYDHSGWFFEGKYGKWVGYAIGYRLARELFSDNFDLAKSINIKPDEVEHLLKGLESSK